MSEGLIEPLSDRLRDILRRAVLDHALAERRRVYAPLLHVGVPGGAEQVFAVLDDTTDHALRCDVVAAMVRSTRDTRRSEPVPLVWLTRRGDLDLQDVDADWVAAARAAYAEMNLPLVFVVVGRHGWRDPRSGASHSWRRLRAPGVPRS